jgi:hypothetical protein
MALLERRMDDRTDERIDAQELAARGIELCRRGDWRQGLDLLRRVADAQERASDLPSLFYSYLGFGIARFDRRVREGITLCQHAIKREFYQPENYVNLARTQLLAGRRREAVEAIAAGRRLDPDHRGLAALHDELGVRRAPVLGFLHRRSFLNRLLGRVRHDLSGSSEEP